MHVEFVIDGISKLCCLILSLLLVMLAIGLVLDRVYDKQFCKHQIYFKPNFTVLPVP